MMGEQAQKKKDFVFCKGGMKVAQRAVGGGVRRSKRERGIIG